MSAVTCSTAAILAGFALDTLFGDPKAFPHIVRLMGRMIAALENVLRRVFPASARGELTGGVILVISVTLICAGISSIALFFAYRSNPLTGCAVESVICWQLMAAKSLREESMKVFYGLTSGDTESARRAVAMIVGRDTEAMDTEAITRAAVETVAENASDGVCAPLFYIALGGAAAGCLYKAVNTMDSMVGYKSDKYIYFGRAAAKTDDVLNYAPSRICAALMCVSSFLWSLDGKSAFRIWRRDRRKHSSPNAAQTEAVCAGALGIRLSGPSSYFGKVCEKPYIGDDTRSIIAEDIVSANRLMYASSVMTLILALMLRVIIGVLFYANL